MAFGLIMSYENKLPFMHRTVIWNNQ